LERISCLVWFGFTSIDIIKTWIFILPLDKTLRQIAGGAEYLEMEGGDAGSFTMYVYQNLGLGV